MDLSTLAAVEAYLNDFKGVVICVSHDRAFADKCSDHLFVFEGGKDQWVSWLVIWKSLLTLFLLHYRWCG